MVSKKDITNKAAKYDIDLNGIISPANAETLKNGSEKSRVIVDGGS